MAPQIGAMVVETCHPKPWSAFDPPRESGRRSVRFPRITGERSRDVSAVRAPALPAQSCFLGEVSEGAVEASSDILPARSIPGGRFGSGA